MPRILMAIHTVKNSSCCGSQEFYILNMKLQRRKRQSRYYINGSHHPPCCTRKGKPCVKLINRDKMSLTCVHCPSVSILGRGNDTIFLVSNFYCYCNRNLITSKQYQNCSKIHNHVSVFELPITPCFVSV